MRKNNEKIILSIVLLCTFSLMVVGCAYRSFDAADDVYYVEISELPIGEYTSLIGYNPVLDEKSFEIESKNIIEDKIKDGYIK